MFQRAVFLASMLGGLTLFGVIGYMQANDKAFTSDPRIDLQSYLYSEVPEQNAVPARAAMTSTTTGTPATELLVLPPVHIKATPTPARASQAMAPAVAAPEAPPAHEADVPCSPWRQIGPRNVDDGVPSGAVHVRQLC